MVEEKNSLGKIVRRGDDDGGSLSCLAQLAKGNENHKARMELSMESA